MARQKYTMTAADYATACRWIENAMTREVISNSLGWNQFMRADTPEKLQAWCDDYLNPQQWHSLKTTIRANRKRSKDVKAGNGKVHVTLDRSVWIRLTSRAEEYNLSLSQTIKKMDDIVDKANDKGIK